MVGILLGAQGGAEANPWGLTMRTYAWRVLDAMVGNGCSWDSTGDFLEDRSRLSEEVRSTLWVLAWRESSRENRRQRVAQLMEGERQLAGRVSANRRLV